MENMAFSLFIFGLFKIIPLYSYRPFFSKITVVELLPVSTSYLRNRLAWQCCSPIAFLFARVHPLTRKAQNFFKPVNLDTMQRLILKSEPKCQFRLAHLTNISLVKNSYEDVKFMCT